jgi:hypothetical protein
MTISIYEPRSMARALAELPPARNFLKQLFFRAVETYPTEKVDVDIQTGTRRLAPFVSTKSPGKVVDRTGFTTHTYEAPMIAPKRPITTEDLQTRVPGEHVYSGNDPAQRQAELLRGDLTELDTMIVRREEWMCREALVSSSIRILGDDVDRTITFPRDASLSVGLLAAADRWDAATADIPAQIRKWRRMIVQLTGVNPNTMLLSAEAEAALLGNTNLRSALNTLRLDLGQIKPELRDSGATYIGQLAGTGIDLWSYDEWYIDPVSGSEDPMIPEKTILLGATNAYTAMRYASVPVADGENIGLVRASRVPESWIERDPAVRWLKLSSRPLPVPVQNNAFLTATVLA